MKVRLTVQVQDALRAYIASKASRTKAGLAPRKDVVAWLQKNVSELGTSSLAETMVREYAQWKEYTTAPLTQDEVRDAKAAIEYLRSAGKTNSEIRAWMLLQRARLDFAINNPPPSSRENHPPP